MEPDSIFQAHDSYVLCLEYTQDGRHIVSAGMDNVIKLWDVADWSLRRTFSGHGKSVNSLGLTRDGASLVTGSSDATVRVWNIETGECSLTLQDRKRVVAGISVSSDDRWIAAGSYKGRTAVWTIEGEPIAAFVAAPGNIASVAFSPSDRTQLVTAGLGAEIKVWSLPEAQQIASLELPTVAIRQVRFTPDGLYLLALTYEGDLYVVDTHSWTLARSLPLEMPGVKSFALDGPAHRCAVLGERALQIRSYPAWEILLDRAVDAKVLNAAAFSPAGNTLVVGAADRHIRVWNLDESSLP